MTLQYFGKEYSSKASENYESYFDPAIGAPLTVDLINLAMLNPGERVLDLAWGIGIDASMELVRKGATGSATCLDINPGILEIARATAFWDIYCYESSAEEIPIADATYDVVLC